MSPISDDQFIKEDELYDGPIPADDGPASTPKANGVGPGASREDWEATVQQARSTARPPVYVRDTAEVVRLAFGVLSARSMGIISTVTACALWGVAVWQPEVSRTYAALGFSGSVLLPIVLLYLRRG